MPGFLAGIEEIIHNSKESFAALKEGIPIQSVAYTGYRGVGKTVLLNRLQEIAEDEYGISGYHIEVSKSGSFIAKLSDHCRKYLRSHSISEKATNLLEKAMDAFISALHRTNQLAYPIMAACGGTPEMIKMLYKEKTYVERLFLFPKLEMLSESEVWDALTIPGEKVHLRYTEEASQKIAEVTGGYPFFVQQYGQLICRAIDEDTTIDREVVDRILPDYYKELDQNFYMVRFEERGALEKEYQI